MSPISKKEEYDSEPVVFCSKCYSLKIKHEETIDADCCMDCGCSDVIEASIDDWEKLYEGRYGKKFVNAEYDPKNSPIFQMSIDELKKYVCEKCSWRQVAYTLYPWFPRKLGKADAVILLFDRLIKHKRLDDLRYLLIEQIKYKNYGREESERSKNGE